MYSLPYFVIASGSQLHVFFFSISPVLKSSGKSCAQRWIPTGGVYHPGGIHVFCTLLVLRMYINSCHSPFMARVISENSNFVHVYVHLSVQPSRALASCTIEHSHGRCSGLRSLRYNPVDRSSRTRTRVPYSYSNTAWYPSLTGVSLIYRLSASSHIQVCVLGPFC